MKRIGFRVLLVSLGFACLLSGAGLASGQNTSTAQSAPESTLRNVRDLAHRMMRASLYVIDDVEQRDMVVTGEPMLIQPIPFKDDNKPIGWAEEAFDLGPAEQPRRKWLDSDMSHLAQLVGLLKEDMQNASIGDQQDASNSWASVSSVAQDIVGHYQKLVDLTKGPKYDDMAIGKEALAIYDAGKRLEKPWTETLHKVKK